MHVSRYNRSEGLVLMKGGQARITICAYVPAILAERHQDLVQSEIIDILGFLIDFTGSSCIASLCLCE